MDDIDGPFREAIVTVGGLGLGQVLVRVAAAGISPLDGKIRAGKAGHARQPLPAVLGLEMAGVVEQVGEGVTAFKLGDEVYGMVGGVGGLQGTLAEYVVADPDLLALKPKNLSMGQAAVMPLNVITAWEGLVDRANVQAGQTVLVHGGAGGVGSMAVQIAVAFGARVFATVSPGKASIVEGYGATPIDYTRVSVDEYVAAHSEGKGFDIVYDTLGGATLDASFLAVKKYTGRVVSCYGWGTHSLAPLSFRGASYSGVFTLMPMITGEGRAHHGEIMSGAAGIAEAGKLEAIVYDRTFGPGEIGLAFDVLNAGPQGKIAVAIGEA